MARATARYVCQACGASQARWVGQCDACHAWNSIVEEATHDRPPGGVARGGAKPVPFEPLAGGSAVIQRRASGIGEFDRVVGGGLVAGSCVLVGGDPGIGKSTLLLQVMAALAGRPDARCIYVSGEEAIDQLRLRASRLGLLDAPVELAAATNVAGTVAALETATRGTGTTVVVIDSIQTMYVDTLDSAPGTVAQVRTSAQELIRFAKRHGAILLLVGHVTKEGMIAGPRVLEHMVDTVLYFEGDRGHQFRILRAVKNRFGPTDEIGVFEMSDRGLMPVENPSALFLGDRDEGERASGAAVFAGMEGTRPVLVEFQSLVAPSALGTPRRAVVGWDGGRLAMVLAVLESRCGLSFAGRDVYLNVAGGLRVGEPAADLAVAAALVSSLIERAMPAFCVTFGEIALSGAIRPVGQTELRLKEAAKLGFSQALVPRPAGRARVADDGAIAVRTLQRLQDLIDLIRGEPLAAPSARTRPLARQATGS
ncbi:MAG: DNA repair protein RadA [Alphaproteobacteria bacterium]|nr:DNA repair protein RadA [Alphaproteobacteria bacterium]